MHLHVPKAERLSEYVFMYEELSVYLHESLRIESLIKRQLYVSSSQEVPVLVALFALH